MNQPNLLPPHATLPTMRQRMVYALTEDLAALFEQARQQRCPPPDALAHFVDGLLDAAATLSYEHMVEQAKERIAARERADREARDADTLVRQVEGEHAGTLPASR
jgi:hypothetical protein